MTRKQILARLKELGYDGPTSYTVPKLEAILKQHEYFTPTPKPEPKKPEPKVSRVEEKLKILEAEFRQDGINYSPAELVRTRWDRMADELQYAASHNLSYITLKVPSGYEVNIDLEVAQYLYRLIRTRR